MQLRITTQQPLFETDKEEGAPFGINGLKPIHIDGSVWIHRLRELYIYTGLLDKQKFSALNCKYLFLVYYVLYAQKNRLIETVLLSTHIVCFG